MPFPAGHSTELQETSIRCWPACGSARRCADRQPLRRLLPARGRCLHHSAPQARVRGSAHPSLLRPPRPSVSPMHCGRCSRCGPVAGPGSAYLLVLFSEWTAHRGVSRDRKNAEKEGIELDRASGLLTGMTNQGDLGGCPINRPIIAEIGSQAKRDFARRQATSVPPSAQGESD